MVTRSQAGLNTNDGRSEQAPVRTLAKAVEIASALSSSSTRTIVCTDSSVFTENYSTAEAIDLYMPFAAITGSFANTSTATRASLVLHQLQGSLQVNGGDHYTIHQVAGNIAMGNTVSNTSLLRIEDYLTGDITFSGVGSTRIEIDHVYAGFTLGTYDTAAWTIDGRIGSVLHGVDAGRPDTLTGIAYKTNEIAIRDAIANNAQLSITNAAEIALSVYPNATFRTTNGRVLPLVSTALSLPWNNIAVSTDASADGAFSELVIPASSEEGVSERTINIYGRSIGGNDGRLEVWNGDPLAAGFKVIPAFQDASHSTQIFGNTSYVITSEKDTHIVFSRYGLRSVAVLEDTVTAKIAKTNATHIRDNLKVFSSTHLNNETLPEATVNSLLKKFGGHVRVGEGRVMPDFSTVWQALFKFTGVDDETSAGEMIEFSIPARELRHSNTLELWTTKAAADNGEVVVYYGDPITGGTKLTPVSGTEKAPLAGGINNARKVTWDVSDTPYAGGFTGQALHIVIKQHAVYDMNIIERDTPESIVNALTEAGYAPDGGGGTVVTETATLTFDGSAPWVDMCTWDATSPSDPDTLQATNFILSGVATDGTGFKFVSRVKMLSTAHAVGGTLHITDRTSNYAEDPDRVAAYRVVRDDSDVNAKVRLQFQTSYVGEVVLTIQASTPQAPSTNFGPVEITPAIGTEVQVEYVNVARWQELGISDGGTFGVAYNRIGEVDSVNQAYINFMNGTVDIHAGDQTIASMTSTGTRLSADEYPLVRDTGFGVNPLFTGSGLPTSKTTSGLPRNEVTCAPVRRGSEAAITTPDGVDGFRSNDQTGYLELQLAGVHSSQRVRVRATALKYNQTQDAALEIRDLTGTSLSRVTWGITTLGEKFLDTGWLAVTDLETDAGFKEIRLGAVAGENPDAIFTDWSYEVDELQPDLEDGVVLQVDSNYRGILDPRIILAGDHPDGTRALDRGSKRPFYIYGNEPAWLKTVRFGISGPVGGAFLYADSGSILEQNWLVDGTTSINPNPVALDGFPAVYPFGATNSSIRPEVGNTDEFWDEAFARGIRMDVRFKFDRTDTSHVQFALEPRNSSGFSAGRFMIDLTRSSDTEVTVSDGTNSWVVPTRGRVANYTIIKAAGDGSDFEIYVDGALVGTGARNSYNGSRGIFIWNNANNGEGDSYLHSVSTYVIEAGAHDHAFSKEDVENNMEFVVPNIITETNHTIAKGMYEIGNTFTIVNGSTEVANISATTGDTMIFNGATTEAIPPFTTRKYVQVGVPLGTTWITA